MQEEIKNNFKVIGKRTGERLQEDKNYCRRRMVTFKVESLAPAVRCLLPAPPTPPIAFSEIF